MRSHVDLEKDSEKISLWKKAKEFYNGLCKRALSNNVSMVVMAFSLDQNGFAEMRDLILKTGGMSTMHEMFDAQVYKDSFTKIFSVDEQGTGYINSGASIDILLSKSIKVQGVLGPCMSLEKKGPMVSDLEMGQCKTSAWYIGCLERNTTLCFYLDVHAQEADSNKGKSAIIQFKTIYKSYFGQMKMRVTTLQKQFGTCHRDEFVRGFDQEAAIATISRLSVNMAEEDEPREVMKWLDKKLIQLYARFGNYNRGNVNSFKIGDEFN